MMGCGASAPDDAAAAGLPARPPAAHPPARPHPEDSIADEIAKLKRLHDEGALDAREFAAAKAKVLAS